MTKLVFQLVERIPNSEPDEETIRFQVDKFKESIAEILKDSNDIEEEAPDSSNKDNSSAKLFEEIKVMFKDLPSRIEGNLHPEYRNRKKRRFHPMMIKEMIHMSNNSKLGILVGLSMLRNMMPWLYDVGTDTLRKIDSDCSIKEKETSFREFRDLIKMSSMNPMIHEFLEFESKDDYRLYEELPHMLMREIESYMEISQI